MSYKITFVAVAATVAFFSITSASQATLMSFQGPSHDSTYIRADAATSTPDDDPDGENLIGRGNASVNDLNSLFAFDLTALANEDLGEGLIINSATLTMYHRDNGDGGAGSFTVGMHEYGFDFIEAASSWNDPAGDGSDGTLGGTVGTLLSSLVISNPSAAADGAARVWASSPDFVTAISTALAGDSTLRLLGTDISGSGVFDRLYDEDEGLNAPLLVVDYDVIAPVPEPSSLLLLGLGGLGLVRHTRRRRLRA